MSRLQFIYIYKGLQDLYVCHAPSQGSQSAFSPWIHSTDFADSGCGSDVSRIYRLGNELLKGKSAIVPTEVAPNENPQI